MARTENAALEVCLKRLRKSSVAVEYSIRRLKPRLILLDFYGATGSGALSKPPQIELFPAPLKVYHDTNRAFSCYGASAFRNCCNSSGKLLVSAIVAPAPGCWNCNSAACRKFRGRVITAFFPRAWRGAP